MLAEGNIYATRMATLQAFKCTYMHSYGQPICESSAMRLVCRCEVKDLKGGDKALNAQILRDVFGGERGAVADALCLNAGVALAACQVAPTAQEGIRMAQVHAVHTP